MPSSRGGKGQIPPAIGSALKISCKKNFGIIPVQLNKNVYKSKSLFSRDTCIFILCSLCIHLKWVKSKSLAEFIFLRCGSSASKEIYNDNVLAISGATSHRQIRAMKEAQNKKKKRHENKKRIFVWLLYKLEFTFLFNVIYVNIQFKVWRCTYYCKSSSEQNSVVAE